jgi:hypothetical protein
MRAGRVSVGAGIAAAVLACGLGALGASSAPGAGTAAISSTPTPSVSTARTPTPTPAPASGLAEPTAGPGGCSIAAPATPPSGLTLYVCYTISGSVNATGGFVDEDQGPGAFSCADWAESGDEPPGSAIEALQAPDPGDAQVEVNGMTLGFDLAIQPYTGPASYSSTGIAQSVSIGYSLSWSTNSTTTATFSANLEADGSGSVTVTNLHDDSSNGTTENATESWVCVMATGT